jgi:hypothetical protein
LRLIPYLLLLSAAHAAPLVDPVALEHDFLVLPRDPWNLLDHRLTNRRLIEQLETQDFRLLADDDRFALAVDAQTGTQVPREGVSLGIWHAHALIDLFATARITEALDLNLNFVFFNITASEGYRSTTGVWPGMAIHLHGPLGGGEIEGELIALDLGNVTLGRGWLLEQTDLEGGLGALRWGDVWLRLLVGAQVMVSRDDLFVLSLGTGTWSLNWAVWSLFVFQQNPQYLTLAGDLPGLGEDFRLGVEAAVRLPDDAGGLSGGALARADWVPSLGHDLRLHLGYQARWYEQGAAPTGDALYGFGAAPAVIWREDTYFTNAFEAWWPSAYYRQWWHTAMVEAQWRVTERVSLRAEVEGLVQLYDDAQSPARRLPARRASSSDETAATLPEPQWRVLYRSGVEVALMPGRPDRLRFWIINKVNDFGGRIGGPSDARLDQRGALFTLELEVFL